MAFRLDGLCWVVIFVTEFLGDLGIGLDIDQFGEAYSRSIRGFARGHGGLMGGCVDRLIDIYVDRYERLTTTVTLWSLPFTNGKMEKFAYR